MIARVIISRDPDQIKKAIAKTLALHLGGVKLNHPDILYFEKSVKLGIAEAKKIRQHFSLKPFSAKGRGAVLEEAGVMTIEAQNALLKTLEELPENAVLLLGTNNEANFLPAVLSRCQITHIQNIQNPRCQFNPTSEVGYEKEIEKLLAAKIEERFSFVEKLKDKEEFLTKLTYYFRNLLIEAARQNIIEKEVKEYLKKLLQAEKWAKQNVNIRAILEYLMLVMPNVSFDLRSNI